jgi:hypothetical protein
MIAHLTWIPGEWQVLNMPKNENPVGYHHIHGKARKKMQLL